MFGRQPGSVGFGDVRDGLSNTVMVGESLPAHCIWNGAFQSNVPLGYMTVPLNTMISDGGSGSQSLERKTNGFKSLHPGGANFTFGDGSVTFLAESIDHELYANLGTRAGGEVVTRP